MFAAGTAAVITPILEFRGRGYTQAVGGGIPGATTPATREHIVGIQFGTRPDTRGRLHRVV
ncbi:Branched-chain amino acid aminotransferase [Actinokineospora spheciospongiae]|uniref:Branched-chain amino acid aminotransferase n=1 Tax=Actinokineospora spheciospongiae TaxID=909613 RepID=W7IJS7_9PSEU|nr:hypothetical protein [Actinokineospora spheciospongiae]EWC61085.1 Branched-chain amino acid aminotransferase [Actinokineospora spheciospongiae]